jgi:hypothetical protein
MAAGSAIGTDADEPFHDKYARERDARRSQVPPGGGTDRSRPLFAGFGPLAASAQA